MLYPYLAKIFEQEIIIINKLRSFLDHASGEAESGTGRSIHAAREAEYAASAKKHGEAAAAAAAENEMIEKMTDEEFMKYYFNKKKKNKKLK